MSKHRPRPGKDRARSGDRPRRARDEQPRDTQGSPRGPKPAGGTDQRNFSAPREESRARSRDDARTRSREEVWIYGYHPAAAALANPARKILRVVATAEAAERLRNDGSVPDENLRHTHIAARRDIDTLVGEDAVHQGVAVLARPLDHDLADVLEALAERENACLVLLDQVTDPHNVGAVLRSAAAFGATAVIAPDRHAPEETGVMAKAASGALDKIAYVKTVNLVRAIEIIKENRFWLVGLDAAADKDLAEIALAGRIALVLGAEGEGMRRLVSEHCDHLARLPISPTMESLNVSNAAAVALYEKTRQQKS